MKTTQQTVIPAPASTSAQSEFTVEMPPIPDTSAIQKKLDEATAPDVTFNVVTKRFGGYESRVTERLEHGKASYYCKSCRAYCTWGGCNPGIDPSPSVSREVK